MTLPQSRLYPLLLSGALALAQAALPAHAADSAPQKKKPSTRSTPAAPPEGMPQYGQGEHGRYLVLKLENSRRGTVAPATPYRLFLTGKGQSIEGTPSRDGILHGITDAQGRSAWVWTREAHIARDFTLVRRIGDGPWGHFFHLQSSSGKAPLGGWPYITTMHVRWGEQWVDLGYSNAQGDTAYFSHDRPAANLSISVDASTTENRQCFDQLDAINRKFSQNDAKGALQLVDATTCGAQPRQQLDMANLLLMAGRADLARPWLDRARSESAPEPDQPVELDLLRERYKLERLLGMPDQALADALELQRRQAQAPQADEPDWANDIAYYLADFPDHLAEAEAQARLSIETAGPGPYNQGTLGWILALRGDTDGGLMLMKRSYSEIPRNEEIVADYGLALWRHGQRDMAARLWDQAQAQCVWGGRMHDALREAGHPHPYFQAANSSAVQAYQQRCAVPQTKHKTKVNGRRAAAEA
ncbi:tetratricopeptide repeat protein [Achromobacter aegrifaciens]